MNSKIDLNFLFIVSSMFKKGYDILKSIESLIKIYRDLTGVGHFFVPHHKMRDEKRKGEIYIISIIFIVKSLTF